MVADNRSSVLWINIIIVPFHTMFDMCATAPTWVWCFFSKLFQVYHKVSYQPLVKKRDFRIFKCMFLKKRWLYFHCPSYSDLLLHYKSHFPWEVKAKSVGKDMFMYGFLKSGLTQGPIQGARSRQYSWLLVLNLSLTVKLIHFPHLCLMFSHCGRKQKVLGTSQGCSINLSWSYRFYVFILVMW